jgi:hypothetical protein
MSALPDLPHRVTRESVDAFMTGIRQAAILLVPGFEGLDATDDDCMRVEQISGGITNALFKVSRADSAAIVRVFGENTELVIDRYLQATCILFVF